MSKKFMLPAIAIAVMGSATYVLAALSSSAGRFVVWGAESNALVVEGAPSGEFISLAAGGLAQTLAIKADGRLYLNAVPGAIQEIPAELKDLEFCAVGIGRNHALAIDPDGGLRVWPPSAAADGAPTAGEFTAVAGSAAFFGVALDRNGSIVTWGGHGDPSGDPPVQPVPNAALARMRVDPPSGRFKAIASRGRHTLALRVDGRIYGWGASPGAGTSIPDFSIFTGTSTSAAWTPDGVTPDGRPMHYIAPGEPDNPYTAVAAGLNVILALRADGTIVQWATDASPAMPAPPSGVKFAQVAAGGLGLAAGIDETGQLHTWGTQPWITPVWPGVYSDISAAINHIAAIETPRSHLWPPNHKMKTIVFTFRADHNCTPVERSGLSLELRSNQPDNDVDDGNTTGDTNGADGHRGPVVVPATAITQNNDGSFTATFELRAERSGAAPDRVYTVAVVSSDLANPAIRTSRMTAAIVVGR